MGASQSVLYTEACVLYSECPLLNIKLQHLLMCRVVSCDSHVTSVEWTPGKLQKPPIAGFFLQLDNTTHDIGVGY